MTITLNNSIRLIGFAAEKITTTKVGSTSVTKFSMATSSSRKDKDSGEYTQFTEWHECEAWGATATYVAKHLRKGTSVTLEGKLEYSSYDKEHGEGKNKVTVKHTRAVIRVNQVELRNKKSSGEEE